MEERVAGDEASGKGLGWCRVETMAVSRMGDDMADPLNYQVTGEYSNQTMRL